MYLGWIILSLLFSCMILGIIIGLLVRFFRQIEIFLKTFRCSTFQQLLFHQFTTSIKKVYLIQLLILQFDKGHGELLELRLLEKSARHDFIIA
jgi:hypothetical protein